MTSSIQLLAQAKLAATATTVYTVPSSPVNAHIRVNALWVANTDSADRTVTLRVGTGALTAANCIGSGWVIPANTTFLITGSEWMLTLGAGYKIEGQADVADKIVVTVSGDLTE